MFTIILGLVAVVAVLVAITAYAAKDVDNPVTGKRSRFIPATPVEQAPFTPAKAA